MMGLSGCEHIQAAMWPLVIVDPDGFGYQGLRLFISIVAVPEQFLFQDAIYPLCYRVLQRVPALGHADADMVPVQQADIIITAVLYPPVRMMDQTRLLAGVILDSHLQGCYAAPGR